MFVIRDAGYADGHDERARKRGQLANMTKLYLVRRHIHELSSLPPATVGRQPAYGRLRSSCAQPVSMLYVSTWLLLFFGFTRRSDAS